MLTFIPAKINIGLYITEKRQDGYHNLYTLFYPIGLLNGTPECQYPFGDILEITPSNSGAVSFRFSGNDINCPLEKNLVTKAYRRFEEAYKSYTGKDMPPFDVHLVKHTPDGAGIGGGSADATYTLRLLNTLTGSHFSTYELAEIAKGLGADCPFFLYDSPMIGEGIGEILSPSTVSLKGKWLLLVKPDLFISTKEAFSAIRPSRPSYDLRESLNTPIDNWKDTVTNDFETGVTKQYPVISEIKDKMYETGALYCSMSGSGSSIYGIYSTESEARKALLHFKSHPFSTLILLT